ncbi:phage tail assembly protein [Brevibacillus composti]|uniref:Phage tail assembly protein n=1 Tax=Brevibacillus composti TaxID=2796470 RepID=A0A7T5JQ05_9BACL|nr:phage tail assembly protein [Brevibacillus composti]QQE75722.1 phage tail assembly protein [Brevibacillus composti]QUO42748.1 phage tail assembly protein [Brevibacillus composti]
MEIKLNKPIEKDGQKIEVINLNMEGFTGKDVVDIERQVRLSGDLTNPNPIFSQYGFAVAAAKMSGLIVDDILSLDAADFLLVTTKVSHFLYSTVLTAEIG